MPSTAPTSSTRPTGEQIMDAHFQISHLQAEQLDQYRLAAYYLVISTVVLFMIAGVF